MTGTERKRRWRLDNPERSRAAECARAQARRYGHWGQSRFVLGEPPRRCASSDSYQRYERSWLRYQQRLWYPRLGAGAHRHSQEERAAALDAYYDRRMAEIEARYSFDPALEDVREAAGNLSQ